jgi:hypothetical protein
MIRQHKIDTPQLTGKTNCNLAYRDRFIATRTFSAEEEYSERGKVTAIGDDDENG